MKKIVLLAFILNSLSVEAQHKKSKELKFHALAEIGVLAGETDTKYNFGSSFGAGTANWFAGIGTGVHYYRFRTVPLYADLRYYFFKGPNRLFVYSQSGYHIPNVLDHEKRFIGWGDVVVKGGLLFVSGLGWQYQFKDRHALFISAGYDLKKISEKVSYPVCGVAGCSLTYNENFNYQLRTFSLKLGWLF